jgi:hypothetical protein
MTRAEAEKLIAKYRAAVSERALCRGMNLKPFCTKNHNPPVDEAHAALMTALLAPAAPEETTGRDERWAALSCGHEAQDRDHRWFKTHFVYCTTCQANRQIVKFNTYHRAPAPRPAEEARTCQHRWTGPIIGPSGYQHYCRNCMERRSGPGPAAPVEEARTCRACLGIGHFNDSDIGRCNACNGTGRSPSSSGGAP